MVNMIKRLFALAFFGFVFVASGAVAQDEPNGSNQAAFDTVQTATDELLTLVTQNREVYLQDTELFFSDVEQLLSSVVDFKRIARRVMAKHYKKAEPEQQQAFLDAFKLSLLKVYAKALLEYDNEKIIVLPPHASEKSHDKKQRVDIELYSSDGKKYPITYSMYLDKENQWKMENVIVNGVNIGLTYRNQFARLMKDNSNDIDLVIAGWTSDVTEDAEDAE